MKNPLRSEAAAFHFLLAAVVYLAAIAVAGVINEWAGRAVSPPLSTPLRHWGSDEDPARAQAQEGLEGSLARLQEEGIAARGEIGDGDPLQAIEDALRTFGADEIIISTHPEGRSNWLKRGLVERARQRFAVPITHVVVDL